MNIYFTFEQTQMMIPVNPEEIEKTCEGDNESTNVVGLGEINILKQPKLCETSIESFAPSDSGLVEFIEKVQEAKKPMRMIVGETKINMLVGIESFKYAIRAGEENDIYYTLALKEWRDYYPKTYILEDEEKITTTKKKRSTADKKKTTMYTVKSGDTLYAISKRFAGNGGKWTELYKLNKKVIGNNPNRIYPKQKLKIPEGW